MTGHGSSGAAGSGTGTVCTACPLLCDDLARGTPGPRPACDAGSAAFAAAGVGRREADPSAAVTGAAAVVAAARRVLVAGLADATNEAVLAACDLAETLGAAIDADAPETSRLAGPTIARAGRVTADWEELRDRADLVIFWFSDPTPTHPRFLERFVTPAPMTGRPRRTIAVGPAAVLAPGLTHVHLRLPAAAAVATGRQLQSAIDGIDPGPAAAESVAAAAGLAAAIATAECVALVTGHTADRVGIDPWVTGGLVRRIAHERPAFEVPLGPGIDGAGGNAAGAAAICTWRYGAAGAISRADRHGGEFLPAECDARRLVDRGEIDCLIAVGRLSAPLDAAIGARPDICVIRIADAAGLAAAPRRTAANDIHLVCPSLLVQPCGTMLRGDGRRVVLGPAPAGAGSMAAIIAALHARVRGLAAGGGRP